MPDLVLPPVVLVDPPPSDGISPHCPETPSVPEVVERLRAEEAERSKRVARKALELRALQEKPPLAPTAHPHFLLQRFCSPGSFPWRLVHDCHDHTDTPQSFLYAAAFQVMAHFLARAVRIEGAPSPEPCGLFTALVGPPAARKSPATDIVDRLLRKAEAWGDGCYLWTPESAQGGQSPPNVRRRYVHTGLFSKEGLAARLQTHTHLTYILDEGSDLGAIAARSKARGPSADLNYLAKLYNGRFDDLDAYAKPRDLSESRAPQQFLEQRTFSLIENIQPSLMREQVLLHSGQGGLFSRFLVYRPGPLSALYPEPKNLHPVIDALFDEVVSRWVPLLEDTDAPAVFSARESARSFELLKELQAQLRALAAEGDVPDELQHFFHGKLERNAVRLAALLTADRDPDTLTGERAALRPIDPVSFEHAVNLILSHTVPTLLEYVGSEVLGNGLSSKELRFLHRLSGCTSGKPGVPIPLSQMTKHVKPTREGRLYDRLISDDLIRVVDSHGRGATSLRSGSGGQRTIELTTFGAAELARANQGGRL